MSFFQFFAAEGIGASFLAPLGGYTCGRIFSLGLEPCREHTERDNVFRFASSVDMIFFRIRAIVPVPLAIRHSMDGYTVPHVCMVACSFKA